MRRAPLLIAAACLLAVIVGLSLRSGARGAPPAMPSDVLPVGRHVEIILRQPGGPGEGGAYPCKILRVEAGWVVAQLDPQIVPNLDTLYIPLDNVATIRTYAEGK